MLSRDMPVFYPRLGAIDLHLVRSPGAGLGNLLFPWARAYMLAERHGGYLISPTWRNVKLGPIIRRESDFRTYGNLFHHRSVAKFTNDLKLKLLGRKRITEDEFLSGDTSGIVTVEGMKNYFADLKGVGPQISQELHRMTRNPPTAKLGGIALHIRMGDFSNPKDDRYSRNSRVALSWYVEEARRLLERFGAQPIHIFTDDTTGAVANAFKDFASRQNVRAGNAIQDILSLASADHIVCSNSTFSLWAIFISEATFSARHPELFSDYRMPDEVLLSRFISGSER